MKNKKFLINKKGQFSIIAAMLVAVVLITAVMTTYSAIRYSPLQSEPQMLSSIDEINLALKKVLGFTVGYYGSVLQVTGNTSYAKNLAYNYLGSGLENIADLRPEWGPSFNVTTLDLQTNWFTNASYSSGNITVKYDLTGIGVYGMTYTASSRLDVNILQSPNDNQACLSITRDENEPLINLGQDSFKFYEYLYSNSTWQYETLPSEPTSFTNGTYLLDVPSNLDPTALILKIEDTRGIMVVASSFSRYTSTLTWNTTSVEQGFHFVDNNTSDVDGVANIGTNGNFTAQQYGPDNIFDTLTEGASGTYSTDYYPSNWNALGSTSYVSGFITDLQSDNNAYMQLHGYPSAFSSSYNTIGYDSQNSAFSTSGTSSLSWTHTTGTGDDRILLVSVDVFEYSSTPSTVTSVTYDGVTLTQAATALYSNNPQVRSYVYYMLNPSSGAKTINVNLQNSAHAVSGGSVTYSNVNQTTPILASTNTGSNSAPTVSLSASGANTKLLFGHVAPQGTSSYSITEGASQTNRWSNSGNYRHGGTTYYFAGRDSDKSVTSGSVTTSWTTSSSANWVAIAVLLQPTQVATAYTCAAEFTGSSNTNNWNNIIWTIDAAATASGVNVAYQLYNYRTGQYMTTGDGYLTDTLGTSDTTKTQTISASLTDYRDASGNWKIKVDATLATQFDVKLDMMKYSVSQPNYALSLEEQWVNVNATNPRQDLCIKTGNFGSEGLILDIWNGASWRQNFLTLAANRWNNISLTSYITPSTTTLTFRFRGSSDAADPVQDTWKIDAAFIKPQANIDYLINLQESTFTCEVLQNGTMTWLGQHIQLSSKVMPIPPLAVKAIHINQTISGVNQEVPFQVEDWSSNYQIPLGLTGNATVFSNKQMIVFLLNNKVSEFTIWWDGRDLAVQTPNAFTNRYFTTDNTGTQTLSNGKVSLKFVTNPFAITSTVVGTTTSSTATLMRINNAASTYGAKEAYVIYNGIVRDIVQQEAEWSNGATGSPNLYANIVITLPANTTYYTYQLRLMFIGSTQPRAVTDVCPIRLTTSLGSLQTQTENGTIGGFPTIQNGTGTFSNYASGGNWTAHHWSQFITDAGTQGAGIMFTDLANQNLYTFDSIAGTPTGALSATSSSLIELLPVKLAQAQFTYPYDITWSGAVATFDNTTPLCGLQGGTTPTGLWILAEYPPTLAVNAKS